LRGGNEKLYHVLQKDKKNMEKIQVKVGWSGKNFSCVADAPALNGLVIVTAKTLDKLKKDLQESLRFHIEGCIQDGDELPAWLIDGSYELEYFMEVSALLHSLDGVVTRSSIARAAHLNEKLLGHYAAGRRVPRLAQRKRIVEGIHAISHELAAVV
jgi:predicted RNase H-like HicB family nuclease